MIRSGGARDVPFLRDMLRHAFNVMLSGRTGPVHLDVPLNVFAERTEARAAFSDEWREDGSVYSAGGDSRASSSPRACFWASSAAGSACSSRCGPSTG